MYLNTITTSSHTGRLGSETAKDLYLCGSWEELEKKVQRDVKLPSPSVKEASDSLNKMCLVAVFTDLENDEELAYLNYSRYLIACRTISQKDDKYKEMLDRSEMTRIEENVQLTVKILKVLKERLIGRYKDAARLENGIKIIRPLLEDHRVNLEAEIEASRNLKRACEELKSLYLISQLLEEESNQQLNKKRLLGNVDNVPEQLQCPVCFETYQELVFQCKNGHNVCSTCYHDVKLTACPECRDDFESATPVRNRALEGLISTWRFDCPFRENGCQEKILCRQMTEHSDSCFYRKSEQRRQITKVELQIKEKEDEVNEYQVKVRDAAARRMKTKTEWWKLELNDKFCGAIENVSQELNLLEMEQQLELLRF